MFTGLIKALCTVVSANLNQTRPQLTIDLQKLGENLNIGDSIAVNGTCLTITKLNGKIATFDVSSETLNISSLKQLTPNTPVNIEPALKASDRLGGHYVLGHVDSTAKIENITKKQDFYDIEFSAVPSLISQLVPKGSIAIDGISLTIAKINPTSFSVAIIPETWNNTNLKSKKTDDTVNIEIDVITKTVKTLLENMLKKDKSQDQNSLTVEKLRQLGF